MNRLGLTLDEAQAIIPRIDAGDHGITLVMSHLACAETLNHPLNARQVAAFREIARLFSGVPASLANSSGIFLGPQYQFDLVRRAPRSMASTPRRKPTIRCSRWSS